MYSDFESIQLFFFIYFTVDRTAYDLGTAAADGSSVGPDRSRKFDLDLHTPDNIAAVVVAAGSVVSVVGIVQPDHVLDHHGSGLDPESDLERRVRSSGAARSPSADG